MNNLIKLSNINKSFDKIKKIKVLKKISFSFKKGKIYSLMGPSGSGKSTLLNLLSLIDRPSSGSIKVENTIINFNDNSKNDIIRANKIGIIYQQDNLLPDFTALENIYLASLASGVNKKESILRAKDLLKKVGLLKRSNHFPSELSGGEKQRVSILRSIINNPKLLLADEPTGSIDESNKSKVFSLFETISDDYNTSIIIMTHDNNVSKISNNILNLSKGRLK